MSDEKPGAGSRVAAWARRAFAVLGVAGVVGLVLLALIVGGEIKLGLGAICGSVGAGRVTRALCDVFDVEELHVAGATVLAPTDAAERAEVWTEQCVSADGSTAALQTLKLRPKDERKAEERYAVDLSGDGQIGRLPEGAPRLYTAPLAAPGDKPAPPGADSSRAVYDLLAEVEVPFRRAHRTAAALRNRATGAVEVRTALDGRIDWLNEWRYRLELDLDDANGFRPLAEGSISATWTPWRLGPLYPGVSLWGERRDHGLGARNDWGVSVLVELTCEGLWRCLPR